MSHLGMYVTLRNVNLLLMLRNVTAHARKSTGHCTACAKAHDFLSSSGKRLHWSENSGAFMEGSEACGVCPPPMKGVWCSRYHSPLINQGGVP